MSKNGLMLDPNYRTARRMQMAGALLFSAAFVYGLVILFLSGIEPGNEQYWYPYIGPAIVVGLPGALLMLIGLSRSGEIEAQAKDEKKG